MANILDYVYWRGDLSLQQDPFNRIDSLILSELAYLKLQDIVPGKGKWLTLKEIAEVYPAPEKNARPRRLMRYDLLKRCGASRRFGALEAGRFLEIFDSEKAIQFSAVTFHLTDGTDYLAYRGTDGTFTGWREDFHLAFKDATPSQTAASAYLDIYPGENALRLGGHSKGGNLALYAAIMTNEQQRRRILSAESFDGPGFREKFLEQEGYEAVKDKIVEVLPESSVIGILMHTPWKQEIVRSSVNGLEQHDPFSWQLSGKEFLRVERFSAFSQFFEEAIDTWLESVEPAQRQIFVDTFFDAIEESGLERISDLNERWLRSLAAVEKALSRTDPSKVKTMRDVWFKLAQASTGIIWNEVKQRFEKKDSSDPAV